MGSLNFNDRLVEQFCVSLGFYLARFLLLFSLISLNVYKVNREMLQRARACAIWQIIGRELTVVKIHFARVAEHPRANGGVAGKNERAGGTGQGDSHAAGEFPLISRVPPTHFRNVHRPPTL